MVKLAADLDHLWAELPYLDRFDAAADAGFTGVCVASPFEIAAKDTQRALLRCDLEMVQIATPPPNYTGGERGFAAVPGLEKRFEYDLRRVLRYCDVLRVSSVRLLAGCGHGPASRTALIANLRHVGQVLPKGLVATLSPDGREDGPICTNDDVASVLEEVGSDRLGLALHISDTDPIGMDKYMAHLAVVQIGIESLAARSDVLGQLEGLDDSMWVTVSSPMEGKTDQRMAGILPNLRDAISL